MTQDDVYGLGMMLTFYIVIFVVTLVCALIHCIFLWKAFVKAGRPGWVAFIPFYNTYMLCDIGMACGWWLIGIFIPYVQYIIIGYINYRFFRSYGIFEPVAIVGIFIPIIPIIMIAVSDSYEYIGPSDPIGVGMGFNKNIDNNPW